MLSERERDFTFRDGERVIRFGRRALADAPGLIAGQGLDGYVLLSTERALADAPVEIVEAASEIRHVPGGPVPVAAASVRDGVGGRALVALGGGRVVDAAKAIAAADGLAVAAVPTTLAGSSFTPFHRMPAGVEGYGSTRPVLAVCDPGLMGTGPMPGLAATAMNALAHATEALYAPGANPVSEAAALRAAELFAGGLRTEPPGPEALSLAGLLAGWAVGTAGLAVHHALCQTIVRVTGTPHALTNAVMLPHTVAFMAGRAPEALGALARALGDEQGRADRAASLVGDLAALAGARRLSELGFDRGDTSSVVAAAQQHPGVGFTPGGVNKEELRQMLADAS